MLEYKKISVPQGRPNRDFGNIWEFEEGNFLAFVSDAPSQSEQRAGIYINNYIEKNIHELKNTLPGLEPEEISLVIADLVTGINDELFRVGKGSAYATLVLTLVFNEYTYVISVGDAVAYIIGESTIRISEITRITGRSLFKNITEESIKNMTEPIRYKEYSYIGYEKRYFTQGDVYQLPTEKIQLAALVSDGAEIQFGVQELLRILNSPDNLDRKEGILRKRLQPGQLKDDVTILLAPVKVSKPANLKRYIKHSLEQMQQVQMKKFSQLQEDIELVNRSLEKSLKFKLDIQEFETSIEEFNTSFQTLIEGIKENILKVRERVNNLEEAAREQDEYMVHHTFDRDIHDKLETLEEKYEALDRNFNYLDDWHQHTERILKQFVHGVNDQRDKEIKKLIGELDNLKQSHKSMEERRQKEKVEILAAREQARAKAAVQANIQTREGKKKKSLTGVERFIRKKLHLGMTDLILIVVSLVVIIFVFMEVKYSFFTNLFSSTPTLPKQVTQPIEKDKHKSKTEETSIPKKPAEVQPLFGKDYQAYLAYFHPRLISFSENPPPIKNKVCQTYEEFIKEIEAFKKNKGKVSLLLPIREAKRSWENLKKMQIKEYTVRPENLTIRLIPKKFVIEKDHFKKLQKESGYTGNFRFKRDDTFKYSAFYFKIEIKKDMELKKVLDIFNLTQEELEIYNPGIKGLEKISKDTFLKIPGSSKVIVGKIDAKKRKNSHQ